ncbi:MAG TPA: hypothetical protein VGK49_12695 [Ilumatobacteraceae bacterium]
MDLKKFTTSDWLKIGGGIGIFIFGFLDWITVSGFGISDSGGNVFDFFWTGTIPWILVIATAVITILLRTGNLKAGTAPWPLILLVATAVAAVLLVIRLLFNPIDGKDLIEDAGGDVGRGIGMWLSVASGIVAFAGAIMGFTEAGGDLKDLTNVDKLKGAFAKGDATDPPPPPPPAAEPPAPPAPPVDPT